MSSRKLSDLIIISLFASIIGLLAQLTIPLPFVPITGQTLAIGFTATILGARKGTMAVCIYLLIGMAGIPVFSEFSSGIAPFFGPTGGYLIGFIPAAWIIGFLLEKTSFTFKNAIMANLVGMVVTLICGAVWLKISQSISWSFSFKIGITPFILVGIVKGLIAAWIGILLRRRLVLAHLLHLTAYEK